MVDRAEQSQWWTVEKTSKGAASMETGTEKMRTVRLLSYYSRELVDWPHHGSRSNNSFLQLVDFLVHNDHHILWFFYWQIFWVLSDYPSISEICPLKKIKDNQSAHSWSTFYNHDADPSMAFRADIIIFHNYDIIIT